MNSLRANLQAQIFFFFLLLLLLPLTTPDPSLGGISLHLCCHAYTNSFLTLSPRNKRSQTLQNHVLFSHLQISLAILLSLPYPLPLPHNFSNSQFPIPKFLRHICYRIRMPLLHSPNPSTPLLQPTCFPTPPTISLPEPSSSIHTINLQNYNPTNRPISAPDFQIICQQPILSYPNSPHFHKDSCVSTQ